MNRYEAILNEVVGIMDSGRKLTTHRLAVATVMEFTPVEIKQIRLDANMTQNIFAACLGVTPKAVESWEGGRSKPSGSVRRLLELMKRDPEFMIKMNIFIEE